MKLLIFLKFNPEENLNRLKLLQIICLLLVPLLAGRCQTDVKNIERPEKVVSKRQIVYKQETYSELAKLWQEYYNEFPSEDAYANWMYSTRYAQWSNYKSLLENGLEKYPSNPILLYLTAMLSHGAHENLESIHLLEKATQLDPSYLDPWFSLAINYMDSGDMEKFDVALRHVLEGGAIADEIMDYNYNVITLLEKNAILITNGDNDTYPGWILTRILKYRPDIKIVNRSLLNADWYPQFVRNDAALNFITPEELTNLRKDILDQIKDGKMKMPDVGPFSDTLLSFVIETAIMEKRPVYLSATLYSSDVVNKYREEGQRLGLVTRVNPRGTTYSSQIKMLMDKWLNEFRTGGLNSWILRYGKESIAGRHIIMNYGATINSLMDEIIKYTPESRLELFRWYKKNLLGLICSEDIDKFNTMWCQSKDIKEIYDWCKSENYLE